VYKIPAEGHRHAKRKAGTRKGWRRGRSFPLGITLLRKKETLSQPGRGTRKPRARRKKEITEEGVICEVRPLQRTQQRDGERGGTRLHRLKRSNTGKGEGTRGPLARSNYWDQLMKKSKEEEENAQCGVCQERSGGGKKKRSHLIIAAIDPKLKPPK